jgi:alkylhydroperoxidase family enzyme
MLPVWARTLAEALPRTTAAMLELDHVHRAGSPLDPVLRGKLCWVAADALGCAYAKRYAEADLRRAGFTDDARGALAAGPAAAPDRERAALAFARQLTLAAYKITDDEVAALLASYGPEAVVAVVHTVAYANFQCRVLLALGASVEEGGPLPPLDTDFDYTGRTDVAAPPRPAQTQLVHASGLAGVRPDWRKQRVADLVQAVEQQKNRQPRIPLPDAIRLAGLPPDVQARAERIVWSKISMGYQPKLTKSWFDTMYTFQEEAQLERVFSNTLFWMITRTNDCFY